MNTDKLFLIAIGGTGMRCLESFTHLCAIGMFDNQEIDILTLDTDESNGNKKRTEELVEQYIQIKTPPNSTESQRGGKPGSKTFFSAKLRLTKYWPNYTEGRDSFNLLSEINSGGDENLDLSSLFFDEDVQMFNLAHGYRAQTHLGSHLMYHSIIQTALNVKRNTAKTYEIEFIEYIKRIFAAGKNARVFIFGSIFGGTGASSIPVIPTALKDAIKITKDQPLEIEAKFGGCLLTEYFIFKDPNDTQKKEKKVIADSTYFTLNSQAALQFYQNDPTVKSTYKSLYHVGWPVDRIDFSKNKNETETITGGEKQNNTCHVTELLCAFGAYDFFTRTDAFAEKEAQYLFRSVEFADNSFHFSFRDFSGEDLVFKNRLAGFYALCLLTLVDQKGAYAGQNGVNNWLIRLEKQGINLYKGLIPELESSTINDYFKKFAFSLDNNSNLHFGWLYQLQNSVVGKFLFPNDSFGNDLASVTKINPGTLLTDASKWGEKLNKDKIFEKFVQEFKLPENFPKEYQKCQGKKDELLAQLFNAISSLQRVEVNV